MGKGGEARGLCIFGRVAVGKRDAGDGVGRQCPYDFWPSQGGNGMKEISSQILINRFIYKNCKHKHYADNCLQHSDR